MKEKSNKKMMILSFIGIIIVVLGHTGDTLALGSELFPYYSFHMALFIFISGFFYNTKNEERICGRKGYIIKKVKKLLIPYFIWNLIYAIILNIIKELNIVSYGEDITFESFLIRPWTTRTSIYIKYCILVFIGIIFSKCCLHINKKSSNKVENME